MSWTCPEHYKVHVHGRDSPERPIHEHCPILLPALAGGSQGFKTLPTRWAHRYLPIDRIQSSWYDDILQPPTQEEWSDILRTLPLGKAAGPSGISNEMLRQIGSHINSALWQLVSLCCIHSDIPTA